MGKSILVIDTPEYCGKCPCFLETATDYCGVNGEDIDSRDKPNWCPLHPIPERKGVIKGYLPQYDTDNHYEIGWNDCIDKIINGG